MNYTFHPGELMGASGTLQDFYPKSIETLLLPKGVPSEIMKEFREAELCASVGAFRGASALLRSTLEKTLKANGYENGPLQKLIDLAADERIITEAHRQRAHDAVQELGNDILHDTWQAITVEEYDRSHRYVQRIVEDFYDSRAEVEQLLRKSRRIQ